MQVVAVTLVRDKGWCIAFAEHAKSQRNVAKCERARRLTDASGVCVCVQLRWDEGKEEGTKKKLNTQPYDTCFQFTS